MESFFPEGAKMNMIEKQVHMYGKPGVVTDDVVKVVDDVINYVGKEINFATSLGLGKSVLFINELYRRAKEDPTIKLKIMTALSLENQLARADLSRDSLDLLLIGFLVDALILSI